METAFQADSDQEIASKLTHLLVGSCVGPLNEAIRGEIEVRKSHGRPCTSGAYRGSRTTRGAAAPVRMRSRASGWNGDTTVRFNVESRPGNSSHPPPTVPRFMAVVVGSSVEESGSVIIGNVRKIVIIQTDPGYGASPGNVGTGRVIATICGAPWPIYSPCCCGYGDERQRLATPLNSPLFDG